MLKLLEEINRHIEELLNLGPTMSRDRALEDAMAVRAILMAKAAESEPQVTVSASPKE